MIIIKLQGGLGNQLFQYALGKNLSSRGRIVKYDIVSGFLNPKFTHLHYNLDNFQMQVTVADPAEIAQAKGTAGKMVAEPMHFIANWIKKNSYLARIASFVRSKIPGQYNISYDPHVLTIENGYLGGYWQSYKYLEPIRNTLLEEIHLKEPLEEKYADLVKKIRETNSVSLHVRRGNYVNDPVISRSHQTFGLEYQEQALHLMNDILKKRNGTTNAGLVTVFVFSDDIEWVKKNITNVPVNFSMIFVSKETDMTGKAIPDYEELLLMSLCKHNIIANSSFSFWAAWLN
jgi:hypothetical protein